MTDTITHTTDLPEAWFEWQYEVIQTSHDGHEVVWDAESVAEAMKYFRLVENQHKEGRAAEVAVVRVIRRRLNPKYFDGDTTKKHFYETYAMRGFV